MARIATVALAVALLQACVSAPTPETPQQRIMGTWTCATESENVLISGAFDYMANGLAKSTSKIDIDAGAVKIVLTADADSTWGFLPDGKLTETVTAMSIKSAKMAGQVMDADMIESLVQPMVDEVVGETSATTLVFGDNSFTSTTEDGIVTTCKR